jgi:methyl-accepting chemotaxis protein
VQQLSERLLRDKFELELQSATESAATLVTGIYQQEDLAEAEKLALAQKLVGPMRYGDDGYFFAYQTGTGVNMIHGFKPDNQGQTFWDEQDSEGNYFIRGLDKTAQEGSLFYQYQFPKPISGTDEAFPNSAR